MVTKSELVQRVAERSGVSQAAASRVVNGLLGVISESLAQGDTINLVGFGSFKPIKRRARQGRNPKTGETVAIPGRIHPKFIPGAVLKSAVDGGF